MEEEEVSQEGRRNSGRGEKVWKGGVKNGGSEKK